MTQVRMPRDTVISEIATPSLVWHVETLERGVVVDIAAVDNYQIAVAYANQAEADSIRWAHEINAMRDRRHMDNLLAMLDDSDSYDDAIYPITNGSIQEPYQYRTVECHNGPHCVACYEAGYVWPESTWIC